MMRRMRAFVMVCAVVGFAVSMPAGAEAGHIGPTITGGIRFSGSLADDTDFADSIDILQETVKLLCFTGSGGSCTGAYAPVNAADGGGFATYNDFTFDPLPAGGVQPLWIFTRGAITYSFDLLNVTTINRTSDGTNSGITLFGMGVARVTGFSPTLANWSFSADGTTETFSFSSTALASGVEFVPAPVPDAGSALTLLGFGLGVVVAARRRFAPK